MQQCLVQPDWINAELSNPTTTATTKKIRSRESQVKYSGNDVKRILCSLVWRHDAIIQFNV